MNEQEPIQPPSEVFKKSGSQGACDVPTPLEDSFPGLGSAHRHRFGWALQTLLKGLPFFRPERFASECQHTVHRLRTCRPVLPVHPVHGVWIADRLCTPRGRSPMGVPAVPCRLPRTLILAPPTVSADTFWDHW